jgi:hypothetical protein
MTKTSTFYLPNKNGIMKTHMKNFVIAVAALGLFAFSACNKQTCPTYSKANLKHTEVKV